jgi:tRNA dimethylallyltransferase
VEAFAFLRGEVDGEGMLERFRQNTRRYAKRQMTWFRRDGRIRWLDVETRKPEDVAREILRLLGEGRER